MASFCCKLQSKDKWYKVVPENHYKLNLEEYGLVLKAILTCNYSYVHTEHRMKIFNMEKVTNWYIHMDSLGK